MKGHDERCRKCKTTVKLLLSRLFGKVEMNHAFDIGTLPGDFSRTLYYKNLKQIYEALQHCRGYKDFVRRKTLPNCDFFVPAAGFVVDFDESQHFTPLREQSLRLYPTGLPLGFDRERWIELCSRIRAKDNYPFYRDEQRAWYDTLRDFIGPIKRLKPTIRFFSRDLQWWS